ncbi:extracellular solute-binding protein [Cohnella candidum]|uniref:extracellular solute-binding protein n=1 Tax=Cohnella candidum TaxID=2674991 RepID=UPI0013DE6F97|nr:extracellular solute-binding protein [Cohnella candidum]
MARRKIALIFLPLFLFALILSPWASAPVPEASSPPRPAAGQTEEPALPAIAEEEPVRLRVAAALNEEEFEYFRKTIERQSYQLPDVTVELERTPPEEAFAAFGQASRIGEAADVMLVDNEWVKTFASSGYLMPADGAFVGEALAEQFDAVAAPLKWNGYIWAVPRDFDPYVLVWNLAALRTVTGESATPPQDLAQWSDLAAKSRALQDPVRWLAIDGGDPFALLAWVQAVSGQRTDTLWSENGNPWSGTPRGEAMALLEREREGAAFGNGSRAIAETLAAGSVVSAILPYSVARKLTSEREGAGSVILQMDRAAWKQPYAWPRGRSFVISSRTKAEDAARRWIAAMTDASVQTDNLSTNGKLPVYRSAYRSGSSVSSLFPGNSSSSFPYRSPVDFGPELPARLQELQKLWREFTSGTIGLEQWIGRWREASADFQLDD